MAMQACAAAYLHQVFIQTQGDMAVINDSLPVVTPQVAESSIYVQHCTKSTIVLPLIVSCEIVCACTVEG